MKMRKQSASMRPVSAYTLHHEGDSAAVEKYRASVRATMSADYRDRRAAWNSLAAEAKARIPEPLDFWPLVEPQIKELDWYSMHRHQARSDGLPQATAAQVNARYWELVHAPFFFFDIDPSRRATRAWNPAKQARANRLQDLLETKSTDDEFEDWAPGPQRLMTLILDAIGFGDLAIETAAPIPLMIKRDAILDWAKRIQLPLPHFLDSLGPYPISGTKWMFAPVKGKPGTWKIGSHTRPLTFVWRPIKGDKQGDAAVHFIRNLLRAPRQTRDPRGDFWPPSPTKLQQQQEEFTTGPAGKRDEDGFFQQTPARQRSVHREDRIAFRSRREAYNKGIANEIQSLAPPEEITHVWYENSAGEQVCENCSALREELEDREEPPNIRVCVPAMAAFVSSSPELSQRYRQILNATNGLDTYDNMLKGASGATRKRLVRVIEKIRSEAAKSNNLVAAAIAEHLDRCIRGRASIRPYYQPELPEPDWFTEAID